MYSVCTVRSVVAGLLIALYILVILLIFYSTTYCNPKPITKWTSEIGGHLQCMKDTVYNIFFFLKKVPLTMARVKKKIPLGYSV